MAAVRRQQGVPLATGSGLQRHVQVHRGQAREEDVCTARYNTQTNQMCQGKCDVCGVKAFAGVAGQEEAEQALKKNGLNADCHKW